MATWSLPVFLFVVWCVWVIACAGETAVSNARRGIPEGMRGGASVLPGIPVFPLAFWGVAWIIDSIVSPWGSIIVGGAHVVFVVLLIVSIVRASRHLRSIDGPA